ncbi:MAG: ABC transporter ATP-binding protein [Solirubrobacteraceae bacterium]|jgi:ABC-type nitrate/sulfonate/bicarbonate transport system ATPase subunit
MVTGRRPGAGLQVRALSKTFELEGQDPLLTLDGVDLVAAPGEFVAVIGPSGCGKTTLFQILAGLESPSSGEVVIDGRHAENRLGACAFMPQRDGLLAWRRTIDNVTIGLELAGVRRQAARERAAPLLERFGLGGFESAWPWQLSGGMRQRAAFLRTVLLGKPAMLLDEPFGALDGITRSELQLWLLEVWSEVGSTVMLITHDVSEAVFLADRVYVMTPRPGSVAASLAIELPRPRTPELAESAEFGAHEARLRELLRTPRAAAIHADRA